MEKFVKTVLNTIEEHSEVLKEIVDKKEYVKVERFFKVLKQTPHVEGDKIDLVQEIEEYEDE